MLTTAEMPALQSQPSLDEKEKARRAEEEQKAREERRILREKREKLKAKEEKKRQRRIDHAKIWTDIYPVALSSSAGAFTQNYKKNDGSISWWKLCCF
ncbi:hypothetical protein PVAG01_08499 [Phlyctema vagabunda]|uniref:Uncharacterized protein n=1 Tax=Phlyctema vagabunda TaxID=108571 RepID=A0ABR4P9P3_9HELO